MRSETSIQVSTLSLHGKTENIGRNAYDDSPRTTKRTNSFVMNAKKNKFHFFFEGGIFFLVEECVFKVKPLKPQLFLLSAKMEKF